MTKIKKDVRRNRSFVEWMRFIQSKHYAQTERVFLASLKTLDNEMSNNQHLRIV